MKGQSPKETERTREKAGEHRIAWTLLYLLAAAVVAGLVYALFGWVA